MKLHSLLSCCGIDGDLLSRIQSTRLEQRYETLRVMVYTHSLDDEFATITMCGYTVSSITSDI